MILPVIMAGGSGSRLWPLSRDLMPKQFLNLDGKSTMLQATVNRLCLMVLSIAPLVLKSGQGGYRKVMAITSGVNTVSERSSHWQLQTIVSQLRSARDQWRAQNGRASGEQGGRELPSRAAMAEILEALCGALFPMRLGPVDLREESEDFYVGHTLDTALNALVIEVRRELGYAARNGSAGKSRWRLLDF